MRIWPGILLLVAGCAGGAVWYTDSSIDGLAALGGGSGSARLTDASALVETNTTNDLRSSTRFFGAAIPRPDVSQQAPTSAPTKSTWSTEVAFRPGTPTVVAGAAATGPARVVAAVSVPQKSDSSQPDLARALQRELKRVGCYAGEVDGDWGPGSRRALHAFIERMNSAIPADEPELIHLTLVRGYPGNACRTITPNQPSVLPTAQTGGLITAARPTPVSGPAISAARPTAAPVSAPSVARAAPTTTIIAEPVENATVTGTLRPAPFEGRMAVGAIVVGAPVQPPQDAAAGDPSAAPVVQRPRPKPQQQALRRDRSWTSSFFNQ